MFARDFSPFTAQMGDGALSFQKPNCRRHRVFGSKRNTHVHTVRHHVALDDLALLLIPASRRGFYQAAWRGFCSRIGRTSGLPIESTQVEEGDARRQDAVLQGCDEDQRGTHERSGWHVTRRHDHATWSLDGVLVEDKSPLPRPRRFPITLPCRCKVEMSYFAAV
jgi:hypothetical protein